MAKKDSKMQYIIGGGYVKLGHIMSKTLCIYGSQVACYIFGG